MFEHKTLLGKLFNSLHAIFNLAFWLFILILFLSCLNGRSRYLEITTHFKLQYFGSALIFTLVFGALRARRRAALAGICLLVSGSSLFGWYVKPRAAVGVEKRQSVRLLLANVLYDNDHYQAVLDLVQREKPDLIFFQEFTGLWERQTSELRRCYPFGLVESRNGAGGIAAFSRLPLDRAEVIDTGNYLGPTLQLVLRIGERPLTLVTAHPPPPNAGGFTGRNRQLLRLAEWMKTLPEPKILIGDLNTTVWSPYLKDFTARSGLLNARQGFGLVPTWPTIWYLKSMQIGIDQCFVSPDVRVTELRAGTEIGSDHFPLLVELAVPLR
jgi:endonuclease/exonuclease/phosphatase (EEP) superfamily protein YafD